jgi:hypothetical protein
VYVEVVPVSPSVPLHDQVPVAESTNERVKKPINAVAALPDLTVNPVVYAETPAVPALIEDAVHAYPDV